MAKVSMILVTSPNPEHSPHRAVEMYESAYLPDEAAMDLHDILWEAMKAFHEERDLPFFGERE